MVDVEAALSEGIEHLNPLAPLLAVPTLLSLLNVGELLEALDRQGRHIGVEFPFPAAVADLWTFVNTPGSGAGAVSVTAFGTTGGASVLPVLLAAVVYLFLYGLVAAGYVGSIQQYRTKGSYDFIANARRYALTYVGLTVVIFGSVLVMVFFAIFIPPLFALVFIAVLVVGYLFWGAWFLVPIEDVGTVEALSRSYRLATTESDYAVWTLVHLALGAFISVFATYVVVTVGASVLGVGVGLALFVPAGFVLTVASLRVVDDLSRERGQQRGQRPQTRA